MSLSKIVPRFTGLKARFSKALLLEFSSLVFYVLAKILIEPIYSCATLSGLFVTILSYLITTK